MKDGPFLQSIRGSWKLLAVGLGIVVFALGEVMHLSLGRKNVGLLVESSILRNQPFLREARNVNVMEGYRQNALFTGVQRSGNG